MKIVETTSKSWGYLLVLSTILALVTTQCANNGTRVEFFEDTKILTDLSPMLNRTVGNSFIIGCRRCSDATGKRPNWFHPNRTRIVSCNLSNSFICTENDENDELVRYLHFTSVTASVDGIYRCTRVKLIININEPAVAISVIFSQSNYSVNEDEGSVQIVLMLNRASPNNITIQVTHNDNDDNDTAIRGVDYTAGPYLVTILAGGTSGSYELPIRDDDMSESDELFHLTIDASTLPDGVIIGSPASATVTIRNDDNDTATITRLSAITSTTSTLATTHTSITSVFSSTTFINSTTILVATASESTNSFMVRIIVAVTVSLAITIVVIIIVFVIGFILFWKKNHNSKQDTTQEGEHYVTTDEIILPRTALANKPDSSNSCRLEDSNEHQYNYIEIYSSTKQVDEVLSKQQIKMEDNPACLFSSRHEVKMQDKTVCSFSSKCEVKMQDNPAYTVSSDHQVKLQDNPAYFPLNFK